MNGDDAQAWWRLLDGDRALEPSARDVMAGHDTEPHSCPGVDPRVDVGDGHRFREALQRQVCRLVRSDLENDLDAAARLPVPVCAGAVCVRSVHAEARFELQKPAEQHDEVLQSAMPLFADRSLATLDEHLRE